MSPRTTKKATGRTNPAASFRLTPAAHHRIDRAADALDTNKTAALEALVYAGSVGLGLEREDIAFAVDSLSRAYGDDGWIVGALHEYKETVDGLRFLVRVGASRNGADLEDLPDWSGGITAAKVGKTVAAALHITHEPSNTSFSLGTITDPQQGNALAVRISHLPELAIGPKGSDPLELRRSIRDSLALLRKLQPATNPDNESEAPLDDD